MSEIKYVKNYMWEYSDNFQRSLQYFANDLFNSMNKNLKPEIILLAILDEEKENKKELFIEPEDCRYSVENFLNIKELAEQLKNVDKDNIPTDYDVAFSKEYIESREKYRNLGLKYKSYIKAIQMTLKKYNYYDTKRYFCSFPVNIEEYMVFIILGLDLETFESYYSLTKSNNKNFKISTSLLESISNEFISIAVKSLKENKELSYEIRKDILEIKLMAGKDFMYTVSTSGELTAIHGLFENINTISSLKYEGKEGLGKLLIASKDHPHIKMNMELEKPILISDFRKVRKFLELSNDENYLISDAYMIYGLGTILNGYNPRNENLFIINFTSHYQWDLIHDNNILMKVSYREPSLPEEKINFNKFLSDFKRIFIDFEEYKIKNLWEIILKATEQKHGTMLLITDNPKQESERLKNQSFQIKPQKIDKELIELITKIDGAVLLDNEGFCYSIGVILDGIATEKGNSARGSRYNSALRYYDFIRKNCNCIIIVVSEDGMIDIIPDLRPQIRHMDIGFKIDNLERIKNSDKANNKEFQKEIEWIYNHKFYLSQKECDKVTTLKREIEEKFPNEIVKITRQEELIPNSDMNESYFSDKKQ